MKFAKPSDSSTVVSDQTDPSFMEMLLEDVQLLEASDHGDPQPGPPPVIDIPSDAPSVEDNLPSGEDLEMNDDTKIQAGLVTIFPPDQDSKWLWPATYGIDADHLIHWCGQFEIAPTTGQLHAHIGFKFVHKFRPRKRTFKECFVKVLEKSVNIKPKRPTKDSMQLIINYVLKPTADAIEGSQFILTGYPNLKKTAFDEVLWAPKLSKSDQRLQERIAWVKSKPTWWSWDMIVHESAESELLLAEWGPGKSFHSGRAATEPHRNREDFVSLFGAPGTGTTTYALSLGHDDDLPPDMQVYTRNFEEDKFWGGGSTAYKGQAWVMLEEFNGQEKYNFLKRLTDIGKPGPNIAIKNGGRRLNAKGIVAASNYHPGVWYRHLWKRNPEHWKAMHRRVTKVLFFPSHKPDGTLNQPGTDEQPDPYFEDMTDEFKQDMGDYEEAWEAFQSVWPHIEDEEVGISNGEHLDLPEAKRHRAS